MDYPCYCCGRPTRGTTEHYVVTHDGREWMSHTEWLALCAEMNYDPKEPDTALGLCGVKWRPETFGSTCYRKRKSAAKQKIEVIAADGSKYLFIG